MNFPFRRNVKLWPWLRSRLRRLRAEPGQPQIYLRWCRVCRNVLASNVTPCIHCGTSDPFGLKAKAIQDLFCRLSIKKALTLWILLFIVLLILNDGLPSDFVSLARSWPIFAIAMIIAIDNLLIWLRVKWGHFGLNRLETDELIRFMISYYSAGNPPLPPPRWTARTDVQRSPDRDWLSDRQGARHAS